MVQSVDDLGTGFEKNVQYYEESITRNTAKLNAMIEPLMMVFLAGMVLVFLLALYLPLFQMGEWIWIEFQDDLRFTLKNKRTRQGS